MSGQRSGYIDQWRGVAVLGVVACHVTSAQFLPGPHSLLFNSLGLIFPKLGPLGVETFFVISGFLITRLMLKEESESGSISLRAFYVRRATRILPAMLFYVLAVQLLGSVGFTRLEPGDGPRALSFLWNTPLLKWSPQFGQLWTLSVEEQFYLLWPLLFVVSDRWRIPLVVIATVIGACCALSSSLVVKFAANNGMAVYCLGSGTLFALSARFRQAFERVRIPMWALLTPLVLLTPLCSVDGSWIAGHPLVLLVTPPILVAVVLARDGNIGGARLSEALRQVGLVSYSLYLWNSFATMTPEYYGSPACRVLALLAIPFAWLSYRYIEKPFIAMGRRWSEAIMARRIPSAGRSKEYATGFLHDSP